MTDVRRLANIVLPHGGALFVDFELYLDESGCDDYSKVLVVGGYLIEKNQAIKMDRRWRALLKQYNLPYFHMIDCAHGVGAFAGMPSAKRSNIACKMFELIEKYVTWGIASACPPHRHNTPDPNDDAYASCLNMCCQLATGIVELEIPGRSVSFVFEDGHASAGRAVNTLQRFKSRDKDSKISGWSFVSKTQSPLVQASDILAWQLAKNIKDKVFNERPVRKDFARLFNLKHTVWYFYVDGDLMPVLIDKNPANPVNDRDEKIRDIFSGIGVRDADLRRFSERALTLPPGTVWGPPGSLWLTDGGQ